MPSASAPVPSRFVPSVSLARLALQAAEEPQARGGVRVWVSCFPEAKFIDEAALFAPPRDRMEATPETLPEADMRDIVQRTQEAIGTRVERLLSSFAFEAAARKETTFLVTEGDQFTAPVCEGLLQSLPIPSGKSGPVFSRLVHEFAQIDPVLRLVDEHLLLAAARTGAPHFFCGHDRPITYVNDGSFCYARPSGVCICMHNEIQWG